MAPTPSSFSMRSIAAMISSTIGRVSAFRRSGSSSVMVVTPSAMSTCTRVMQEVCQLRLDRAQRRASRPTLTPMSERPRETSEPPHIDADAVARKTFSSSFRGYDTDEVRAFLLALAEEVRAVNEHTSWLQVQLAAAEERATAHVELDEERLTALLGEETTRVLGSAREAAAAIRSRAESDAERVLSQASEEATAMRSDA